MCLPSIIPECSAVDNEKLRYGDNGTRNETDTRGAGHWNEFRREAWTSYSISVALASGTRHYTSNEEHESSLNG